MKRKFFKRLATAIAATAMTVTMMAGTAMAAEPSASVQEIDDSSTIHVYVYDNDEGNIGDGSEQEIGNPKPVQNAQLKWVNIGSLVQVTDDTSTKLMFHVNNDWLETLKIDGSVTKVGDYNLIGTEALQTALAGVSLDDLKTKFGTASGVQEKKTDDAGLITISSASGLYLFIGGDMPDGIVTRVEPFLVSAPMPKADGTGLNTTIYAYPKVRSTTGFDFQKTATDGKGTELDVVAAGTEITYTLTATVPELPTTSGGPAELTKLEITDTMPGKGLTFPTRVEVKVGGNTLASGTDYEFTPPTAEDTEMKITFTKTGLEKLAENAKITITYKATVTGEAVGPLENSAKLNYTYDDVPGTEETTEDTVYTYGIDLTKTLSGTGTIEKNAIKFKLYQNSTEAENIVKVSGSDGVYKVDQEKGSDTIVVPMNGKLTIDGLADGTYLLVETASQKGYSKLEKPIEIEITKSGTKPNVVVSATVDGQSVELMNDRVPVKVENTEISTGFTLPRTGGAGTIVAVAIGFACICGAVVLLSVYRRKQK